jgi:hypothetical protein
LTTLFGEALFVLPWFWLPMVLLGWRALRGNWRERLLAWLAAPPIVVFALISAWSSQRVLFHWAAPGYLMLFPFLGRYVATNRDKRAVRATLTATAALCIVSTTVIAAQIQFDWLHVVMPSKDPTTEGLDWTSLRDDLSARGLLRPGTVVGVPNWRDAGKIAHALGPDIAVVCLNPDARQFAFSSPPDRWIGHDMLLLIADHPEAVTPILRSMFKRLEPLSPSPITLRGSTLKLITVAIGIDFTPSN